jgi:gliding motility-associated-like protein
MNTKISLFYLLLLLSTSYAQVITVDDTRSAQNLVENVLVKSGCATILNSTATGDTFTPGQNSYGYFNKGTSNFPLSDGVILSTSSIRNAIGPYFSDQGGGSTAWKGDPDIDLALGINSINATVLEFDFVPLTNSINFNYIFASNEYQIYFPCKYSDAFAFLIKEKGSTDNYKNIAVLPGTTTPVSSKNVHPLIDNYNDSGVTQNGCPAINETYFNGYNTATSPINYSGQIVKLSAYSDVIVGKTYHIKLVIADDDNNLYDSAIFLEAGSFKPSVNLGPDRSLTSNDPICFGDSFTIDTKLPTTYQYQWFKDGSAVAITGATNPSLMITSAGTYKVRVYFSPTCFSEDQIKVDFAPPITLNDTSLLQCDNDTDGFTTFDLTKIENNLTSANANIEKISYFRTFSDAQNDLNPILNSDNYINSILNEVLYIKLRTIFGCTQIAKLSLIISNNSIAVQSPIEKCDTDNLQNGITTFDLNALVTPQVLSGLATGMTVDYYASENDAILQKNKLPNNFTNTIANQQVIYARIVNGSDCYSIIPETLIINSFDPTNFDTETAIVCDSKTVTLSVQSGFSSYLWNTGATTKSIITIIPGDYSVTVTNTKGCQKTKNFTLKPSGIGTITSISVEDFSGTNNSVLIIATGNGNYEYSLDGNYYQESPVFNGISAGSYWATTKDKNGCGVSAPYQLYVLDYPRFFTPNNDGFNDSWIIKNLEQLPKSTLLIFNRYGKLLKELNRTSIGWNGTFNEKELPSDDYWFVLSFEDGKKIKGHFSLKR